MQEKLLNFVESELSKEFEVPEIKTEAPKDVKCEEIFVKCEPDEVPDEQEIFDNFNAELELQKAFEFTAGLFESAAEVVVAPAVINEAVPSKKLKVEKKKETLKNNEKKSKNNRKNSKNNEKNSKNDSEKSKKSSENREKKPKTGEKRGKGKKTFMCPYCGKLKFCRTKLEDHIAGVHQKSKRIICDLCPFRCATKNSMTYHIKTHIAMEFRKWVLF